MKISLAVKYRPATFDDVVGQKETVTILRRAIEKNQIAHGYLFSGPHGVGKTTLARIFAKGVNCLAPRGGNPCSDCDACRTITAQASLDLIEIDAASHRSVEAARELRERVNVPPLKLRYKVFIIDEAHMLTREAFNTLLKTLEEPPPSIIFILATTEPTKLPKTILSRLVRFQLQKLTTEDIADRLATLLAWEKQNLSRDVIDFIVAAAQGSVRDAETLLTQVLLFPAAEQTVATLRALFGFPEMTPLQDFMDGLIRRERTQIFKTLTELDRAGVDFAVLAERVIEYARGLLWWRVELDHVPSEFTPLTEEERTRAKRHRDGVSERNLIRIIETMLKARATMKFSPTYRLPLEIAIMKLTRAYGKGSDREGKGGNYGEGEVVTAHTRIETKDSDEQEVPLAGTSSNSSTNGESAKTQKLTAKWVELLKRMQKENPLLFTTIKEAGVVEEYDHTLAISFRTRFAVARCREEKNRRLLETELSAIFGAPMKLLIKELSNSKPLLSPEELIKRLLDGEELTEVALKTLGGEIVEEK